MCFFKEKTSTDFQFPDTLKVTTNVKLRRYDIQKFVKYIIYNLLGYSTVHLTIAYNNKQLERLSTKDVDLQALLTKLPMDHTYTLYLHTFPTTSVETILVHEMIHLDQYERGDLKELGNGKFIWKGVEYDASMPYDKRPWEKEAFAKQTKILKQVKQIFK